ncbi:WD repeat-containing protein 44-like isoform X1 [Senna tora]|uniref:WD repeat-containing protein 44-like isoform X1 n=1 Tax=Senna tora TaxID=362788 RepID=A0A834WX12_9FABA|nr:WD repeat-containing protein 44-like isoform X1 [Senna tora]
MLNSNEANTEIFFDSLDSLSPQDSSSVYEVWLNEPESVKERRRRFLQEIMDLPDLSSKDYSQENKNNTLIEANFLLDEHIGCQKDANFERKVHQLSCSGEEQRHPEAEFGAFGMGKKKKKMKNWWKYFVESRKGKVRSKLKKEMGESRRVNVKQKRKKWMELSDLYFGQEIKAHKGLIWTIKFSANGQYLASGGEDGVVRVWRIVSNQPFLLHPNKAFQIEESPLQEFYGHSSDVLDLAWSDSDILLSSSMDKTVRLWQIGCNQYLSVFQHNDYVTCIQFNPVDHNYFISGSIDGKVRIWGVCEERVVDWADIRDVITAISYQPDGEGFIVGSITGACRFYALSGKHFQLEAQIWLRGKKKNTGNKITGIQFSQEKHKRVMITSEDSKVRVFDGIQLVQKFKGLPKSGSQMSGSFTSSGKHIISVGDDSHVYIWNLNDMENASSKQVIKSNHSYEYFFTEGVTIAVPWSGMNSTSSLEIQDHQEASSGGVRESERFSLGNWLNIDGTCRRGSVTWPEEKLPSWDLDFLEDEHERCVLETWGLSIVVADLDGSIKTFHNFGLPVRL